LIVNYNVSDAEPAVAEEAVADDIAVELEATTDIDVAEAAAEED